MGRCWGGRWSNVAIPAGRRRGRRPRARLRRVARHDGIGGGTVAALAPAGSICNRGARVVRVCGMVAGDGGAAGGRGGGRGGGGGGGEGFPRPGGEEVDTALIVVAGVVGEVSFHLGLVAGCGGQLVARLVDRARHERRLVGAEVFLDGGAEEAEVRGRVAFGGPTDARQVLRKNLLFEAVDGVRDALQVLEVRYCVGDGGVCSVGGGQGSVSREKSF